MSRPQWPAWWFGPNGEQLPFEKAEDVPQGWQDHPSKFQKRFNSEEKREQEGDESGEGDNGDEVPKDLTREKIIADLERRKVPFKKSASDKALYRLLLAAVENQG